MMQDVITFILRMFTACFYTLIFLGALFVAAVIVTLNEWVEDEKEKEKRK